MRVRTLTMALCCAALFLPAVHGQKKRLVELQPLREVKQPAQEKATAASADPTEPPMTVEVNYGNAAYGRATTTPRGQKIEVESNARGTTLKVPTQGQWTGSAELSFKNSAAPMRFTTRLTGMPNYDLSSLTLTSGTLTIQVGGIGTTATTKYYTSKGQEQTSSAGAAYIVRAKRGENGQMDVELRRAAGAALGKTLSLSWQSNVNDIRFGLKRLGGG